MPGPSLLHEGPGMGLHRHGVPPFSGVPDAGLHRPEGDSSAHSSYTSVPPFPVGQALLFRWRCQTVFYGEDLSLLSDYPAPGREPLPVYWQHRQLNFFNEAELEQDPEAAKAEDLEAFLPEKTAKK